MPWCISDSTACGLHRSLPNRVGYINAASIYTLTDILREPTLHKRKWCAMKLAVMAIYNRVNFINIMYVDLYVFQNILHILHSWFHNIIWSVAFIKADTFQLPL